MLNLIGMSCPLCGENVSGVFSADIPIHLIETTVGQKYCNGKRQYRIDEIIFTKTEDKEGIE
jgi:hypothetical protein